MKAAVQRWQQDSEPMDGIRQISRSLEVETDDLVALAKNNPYWSDLMDIRTVPVIDDEEAMKSTSG